MIQNNKKFNQLLEQLIESWKHDSSIDKNKLHELLFSHLHSLVKDYKQRLTEKDGHSIFNQYYSTTTVLHELYDKLLRNKSTISDSEKCLIKTVTDFTRTLIFDMARKVNSQKRLSEYELKTSLQTSELNTMSVSDEDLIKLVFFNKALERLGENNPVWKQIIIYKEYGGFNQHQIAKLLACSRSKVQTELKAANHWLAAHTNIKS